MNRILNLFKLFVIPEKNILTEKLFIINGFNW